MGLDPDAASVQRAASDDRASDKTRFVVGDLFTLRAFGRDGFVVVRGLLADRTVEWLAAEADSLIAREPASVGGRMAFRRWRDLPTEDHETVIIASVGLVAGSDTAAETCSVV